MQSLLSQEKNLHVTLFVLSVELPHSTCRVAKLTSRQKNVRSFSHVKMRGGRWWCDMTQKELLEKVEGSRPYGADGIIFHNGSCVVTVAIGYDANKALKWYCGRMTVEDGKLFETICTGCYSYTQKPFIEEYGEVPYDATPVNHYPLPRAKNLKAFNDPRYNVRSVDTWEEFDKVCSQEEGRSCP